MNVLFVDQFSEMGGGQRVLVDTMEAAQGRGWNTHAALPAGDLAGRLRATGIPVTNIPCGPYKSGNKSVFDLVRFAIDLRDQVEILDSLLANEHFDLMYVNGPRLWAAASLTVRRRAPVLFHMHYPIHQSAAARLAAWSIRRANATIVGCSHAVLESMRGHMPPGKSHVIENGVADLGFDKHQFGEGEWRIGLIGRISRQKGQIDFIRAASLLAPEWPAARFYICGAPLFGEDDYAEMVQKAAVGLPVEFLGWREDIGSVLAGFDLLAMPSQDEGMPLVLLEAFSAGVPVVAYPTGGIPEVISDGVTGFLTKDASPRALATRLREAMAAGPGNLQRVATNARGAWKHAYTLDRYQDRITAMLESLVSAGPVKCGTEMPRMHR